MFTLLDPTNDVLAKLRERVQRTHPFLAPSDVAAFVNHFDVYYGMYPAVDSLDTVVGHITSPSSGFTSKKTQLTYKNHLQYMLMDFMTARRYFGENITYNELMYFVPNEALFKTGLRATSDLLGAYTMERPIMSFKKLDTIAKTAAFGYPGLTDGDHEEIYKLLLKSHSEVELKEIILQRPALIQPVVVAYAEQKAKMLNNLLVQPNFTVKLKDDQVTHELIDETLDNLANIIDTDMDSAKWIINKVSRNVGGLLSSNQRTDYQDELMKEIFGAVGRLYRMISTRRENSEYARKVFTQFLKALGLDDSYFVTPIIDELPLNNTFLHQDEIDLVPVDLAAGLTRVIDKNSAVIATLSKDDQEDLMEEFTESWMLGEFPWIVNNCVIPYAGLAYLQKLLAVNNSAKLQWDVQVKEGETKSVTGAVALVPSSELTARTIVENHKKYSINPTRSPFLVDVNVSIKGEACSLVDKVKRLTGVFKK